MNWDDDDYDEAPKVATRRPNFVAPAPAPVVRYEVLPPETLPMVTPASVTESRITGTHVDRAKGFQVATLPVSVAFGVGVAVVGAVGFGVPVLSLTMLAVFWIAFLGWWLCGWALHLIVSPDGVALVHTLRGWAYLEREQRARLKRYDERGTRD